jgi:hypothetical protein
MSVILQTAFNPGDADPGHTYPKANIVFYSIRPEVSPQGEEPGMLVHFNFGNIVNGSWVKGLASPDRVVSIVGVDYTGILAEETTVGEDHKIYAGAKRVLYQYLIDKGHLLGTIE